jgi:oligoendopeptidase F
MISARLVSRGRSVLAGLACAVALSLTPPARAEIAPACHVDLAKLAWATPEAERGDRRVLEATLDSLKREAGATPLTSARLLRLLRLADRASTLAEWHGDYYHLRAALDTRDLAKAQEENAISIARDKAFESLHARLARLDDAALRRFLAQEPGLVPYRYFIAEQRRLGARPLAPRAAELGSLATSWQFPLYQRLIARTDFGTVQGPQGPLDVRRQRIAIAASPDSAVRNEGARKLAEGYASSRDLFAFTLLQTVDAQNTVARSHGYPDRPAPAYAARQLKTTEVRALIAAVRARGSIFQRYEAARARSQTALAGRTPPRLTQRRLADAMRAALSPLGPEYARELDALLDPANGRLELGPGEHRQAGGFSFVLPGGVHGVYLDGFEGYPADVSRLAHESGHALHFRLYGLSGAPAVDQPAFPEAVALLDQLLVPEHLARTAASPADALYWRQQSMRYLLEVFLGAKDAELEQTIYDEAAAGRLRSADDLDRLTARVDSAYTVDHRPAAAARWMRASLLVEDPLYYSNYLYSGLILAALYQRCTADPQGFAPGYLDFMRQPASAPPRATLMRTLGIALDDPALLRDAFALLEREVVAFEVEVAKAEERGD